MLGWMMILENPVMMEDQGMFDTISAKNGLKLKKARDSASLFCLGVCAWIVLQRNQSPGIQVNVRGGFYR